MAVPKIPNCINVLTPFLLKNFFINMLSSSFECKGVELSNVRRPIIKIWYLFVKTQKLWDVLWFEKEEDRIKWFC